MHDEQSWLRAILDQPDDDALRLVYSDWLEEQGDAGRAEFIRVQVALAGLDETHERRAALEVRERELLRDYGEAWAQSLRGLATQCEFRRGFLERATVGTEMFLEGAVPPLFRVVPLRDVEFRGGSLPRAQDLGRSAHLARLTGLGVSYIGEWVAEFLTAASLPELQTLRLSWGQHGEEWARILAGATRLGRLTNLILNYYRIGDSGVRRLSKSALLGRLLRLSLEDCNISHVGIRDLAGASQAQCLTRLDLGFSRPGEVGLDALGFSPYLTSLKALSLARVPMSNEGYANWLTGPVGKQLQRLDLTGSRPARRVLQALATSLVALRELSLNDCQVGWEWLPNLLDSPVFGRLRILRLAECALGDEGAGLLAESPAAAGLTTLDLRENAIGDEGARALLESTHLLRLKKLSLGVNRITSPMKRALVARFGAGVCFQAIPPPQYVRLS